MYFHLKKEIQLQISEFSHCYIKINYIQNLINLTCCAPHAENLFKGFKKIFKKKKKCNSAFLTYVSKVSLIIHIYIMYIYFIYMLL